MPPLPVVEFVTRRGCCLCDEALAIVLRAAARARFELVLVDVDSSPELQEDHGSYVPVVIVDGHRFAAYHVDEEAFVAFVASRSETAAARRAGDAA